MSASRTLLNKQGRRPGPYASARAVFPVPRARRMATPSGSVSVSNYDRIKSAVIKASLGA